MRGRCRCLGWECVCPVGEWAVDEAESWIGRHLGCEWVGCVGVWAVDALGEQGPGVTMCLSCGGVGCVGG